MTTPKVGQAADQIEDTGRSMTALPVAMPDLESEAPLLEEDAVGVEEAVLGVVDVGDLRGDAVQLENLDIAS